MKLHAKNLHLIIKIQFFWRNSTFFCLIQRDCHILQSQLLLIEWSDLWNSTTGEFCDEFYINLDSFCCAYWWNHPIIGLILSKNDHQRAPKLYTFSTSMNAPVVSFYQIDTKPEWIGAVLYPFWFHEQTVVLLPSIFLV